MSEIEQYLTQEEKKEIALRVFEGKLRTSFSTAEAERVITNMAYEIAKDLVDKNFGEELENTINKELPGIVNELSGFVVVSRGDNYGAFRKEPTLAWKVVDEWVKKNNAVIEDRVLEIVNGIDKAHLREEISTSIYKAVVEPTLKDN